VETGVRHDDASVSAYGDGINGRSCTSVPETVQAWRCAPECPVRRLDEQSGESRSAYPGRPDLAAEKVGRPRPTRANGVTTFPANVTGLSYSDAGGASRFFYTAKADAEDRDGTKHPTVKPVDLMKWLVKLVTPPGGTVLDPFMGSGPTIYAARELGFRAIGIEREPEYVQDALYRLRQGVLPFAALPREERIDL
jgi:site-specific DNA-methyltransferase (adenine-specific)